MLVKSNGSIIYSINDNEPTADLGCCPYDTFQRADEQLLSQALAVQALVKRKTCQQDGRNAIRTTASKSHR